MTRRTSIAIYREIEDNGLLSARRWQIYQILFKHGPLTANEAFQYLAREIGHGFRFDSNTRARFTELRECGAAYEVGEKVCSVTGVNTILWDVTDKLPRKVEKDHSPTRVELINALCLQIEKLMPHLKPTTPFAQEWLERTAKLLSECEKYRRKK